MTTGWSLDVEAPSNGRTRRATVRAMLDGDLKFSDKADLAEAKERRRVATALAALIGRTVEELEQALMSALAEALRKCQQGQGRAEASGGDATSVELLDSSPDVVRRPLGLVAGRAYAATWIHLKIQVRQDLNKDGDLVHYNPPQERIEQRLVVIRDDGVLFADPDAHVPGGCPWSDLGLSVALTTAPAPNRLWSGRGVKAFVAGKRPDAAEVFRRVVTAVDRFMDFARSFGPQRDLCELTACYVLATYLLDAFNVIGYFWPNGDRGSGKTNYLSVIAELAYLGQLILAGGTYASLRDLADYGATLAFDDAEGVMDVKRTDPDKRALLLAGNRRGATITVKELSAEKVWVTRHVSTFCPRLFSAIRLPDDVLASRTITLPLVRSADPRRAKVSPSDPDVWPCDRRQLVDDLWAVGLAHLPEVRQYDAQAAARASLSGRDLEPWRAMLAVALWLQDRHGVADLFRRVEGLMLSYQQERGDFEATHDTRVLVKALLKLATLAKRKKVIVFSPKELAEQMNRLAREDDQVEEGERFTSPRKVGWLLKQQRFRRSSRSAKGKFWQASRQEIVSLAKAYGVTTGRKKP
jgi:hypothetical protein